MLPVLKKGKEREFSATETKVYDMPREMSQHQSKRQSNVYQNGRTNKPKVGGGFRISNAQQEPTKGGESVKIFDSHNNYNSRNAALLKKSSADVNHQIRAIEKKIRQCQRKIEQDKRRKQLEEQRRDDDRYAHDFEKIIRKELEMQGYRQEPKGFDYLTNPGGPPPEEVVQEGPPAPEPQSQYNISANVEKLQRFYQNSLKKKFERRQMFPHKQCRRKTPKLYITQPTNALNKFGKPTNEQEHRFRVMTKETTPQEIYPVIPNFAVVKDNLSKNILAYLGDYKPFIQKTKQKVGREAREQEEEQHNILVDNSNKSLTISN